MCERCEALEAELEAALFRLQHFERRYESAMQSVYDLRELWNVTANGSAPKPAPSECPF